MDLKRVYSILDNKEKCDIFYDDRPVWIQGVNENIAKVGFIDNFEEKDVFIYLFHLLRILLPRFHLFGLLLS